MTRFALGLALFPLALLPLPSLGAGVALTLTLPDPGGIRRVTYTCDGLAERLAVEYVNAEPNYLALVPVESKTLVFVSVLAGSGARYAAGHYEWWTKGADASLRDVTADADAPALLTCLEANDTP